MKYTVRTHEGELTYGSFGAVELAWRQGLVGPEDEILEEGKAHWRKAGSIALLAQARRSGDQVWGGSQMAWIIGVVIAASIGLYFLVHGNYLVGGLVSLALCVVLFRITTQAFKRTKPHG